MTRALRALGAALVAVAIPSFGAAAVPNADEATGLTPAQVLRHYAAALALQKIPPAETFDYSVEQLGLRDMEQTHRVYRTRLAERDETTIVDGYLLPRPEVRIFANRAYRYDVHEIAPTPATYAFTYEGARVEGDDIVYDFRTAPTGSAAFAVSEIEISSRSYLPTIVRFTIAGPTSHGSGQLTYGLSDGHWVIQEAQVSAHLANGTLAHELIRWSNYQFPQSLPASTFIAPRPAEPPPEPAAS